jgi:hypothetical protein
MAITAGGSLNSVPAPQKQTLNSNYLDFTGTTDTTWAQQYLPDLMEKEAEVFGPRTISGFLSKIGAEEAMTSDQVVWSEQGRLHLSYKCSMIDHDAGISGNLGCKIEILTDIDGQDPGNNHGVRLNDTVIVAGGGKTFKGIVTEVSTVFIEVIPYDANDSVIANGTDNCTVLVYGSEFRKGVSYPGALADAGGSNADSTESRGANEPKFQTFTNKPIILKDYYEVSGSDTSRIGWVEITGEEGQSGYLWYLKAEDMLASMNSYGAGGTSYGVFENDEDMALNLGFSGFRRGSYDFYKSDFRYLNDLATRGGINAAAGASAIRGVIIPAGTSTVYDQQLGKNLKRPFLHVRYRASQTDDRRMKTWTTGSVGAATSALDAMQIHFLSERCLITQGANNFMLMK